LTFAENWSAALAISGKTSHARMTSKRVVWSKPAKMSRNTPRSAPKTTSLPFCIVTSPSSGASGRVFLRRRGVEDGERRAPTFACWPVLVVDQPQRSNRWSLRGRRTRHRFDSGFGSPPARNRGLVRAPLDPRRLSRDAVRAHVLGVLVSWSSVSGSGVASRALAGATSRSIRPLKTAKCSRRFAIAAH
jgi:hypothetical protein